MFDVLSFISSKDVDGVRIDSKIFSGLSLSVGFGVGESMRPRNTDAADPPRCCDGCGPLDVDDDDCCCFGVDVETSGDFGKWIGVVPPNTSVVVAPPLRESVRNEDVIAGSRTRGAYE